jgi:ubiquinone/menaquinone biosynthesis C-methylase UbiE
VALAATKGDQTLAHVDVHSQQISERQSQLLEEAGGVFATAAQKHGSEGRSVKNLQANIGRLKNAQKRASAYYVSRSPATLATPPLKEPSEMNKLDQKTIFIPQHVYDSVVATQGIFFERLSGVDRHKQAADLLSEAKAHQQAAILQQYANLNGARLLEVGAGLAMNLLVWSKHYRADVHGIEPDAVGFDASFKLGRTLMEVNGLEPDRIVNSVGEKLPFPDNSFDIVYSTNVLEHTERPLAVLCESLRVLRPGGTLQFVFPSYGSYYDGHYGVFHPPVLWRGFFPWYVRWIWGRDPAFAHTLRTELNVGWTLCALREMAKTYRFEVLGLGQDIFRQRMVSLNFGTWASLGRVKRVLMLLGHWRVRALLAELFIAIRGWSPIIITLRKHPQ